MVSYLKSCGTVVDADCKYCIASDGDILNLTFAKSVSHSWSSSLMLLRSCGLKILAPSAVSWTELGEKPVANPLVSEGSGDRS